MLSFKPVFIVKNLYILLALSFVLTCTSAHSQQGWEAGGMIGVSHYFGDLNTTFKLDDPGFAALIGARYNFNNRICFRLSGGFAQVSADDADSDNAYEQLRNLSFRSNILEGTGQLEFNFLPYTHGSRDEFFTPYLFAGLTVFNFNPQAFHNNNWVDLRPLGTEGQFKGEEYSSTTLGIAYGFGFKIDISYEWSVNLEISGRKLYTDYLDDVSTVYPDIDDLENLRGPTAVALSDRSLSGGTTEIPIGRPGFQRGNSNDNDSFGMVTVGMYYYFGDLKCPQVTR